MEPVHLQGGNMRKTTSLFCVLTLLSVASSFAGISVDHDKSADFSQYRSFTIKEATPAINPLMRERLIKAIEVGLGAKGLEKVDDGADLKVVVHTSTDTEQRILADTWGYGGYPGWRGWGGWGTTTVDVLNIDIGTLMLDIVDMESNKLVWRGVATDSIPLKSEKLEKRIYKAVDKLFRHYPPEE
jgi:hypothetical protein